MRKKFVAILLVLATLVQLLPSQALAAMLTDRLIERMSYVISLTGMEEDAAQWHDGMAPSKNMNANQIYQYLTDLMENVITPSLATLEESVLFSNRHSDATSDELDEELQLNMWQMRELEDEIRTCLEIIEYEREYVYDQMVKLKRGDYDDDMHTRESIAYSVSEGVERLEENIALVLNNYVAWEESFETFNSATSPNSTLDSELVNHVITVRTQAMDLLNKTAEELNGQEQAVNDPGFEVEVMTQDELGFLVYDADGKPIANAKVTMWLRADDGSNEGTETTVSTNTEGKAFIHITSFKPDYGNYVSVGYEITADGYRTHYSQGNRYAGGSYFKHYMQKDTTGGNYVAGVSFNGRDAMWEAYPIYITDKNDATQKVTVILRNNSGTVANDTVTLAYDEIVKGQINRKTVRLQATGKSEVSYTSKLCMEMKPGVSHAFDITLASKPEETFIPYISTKAATYEEPRVFSDSTVFTYLFSPGMNFQMPQNIPFLDLSTLNLDIGMLVGNDWANLVHGYGNVNGDWFIGIGPGSDFEFDGKLTKNWKTKDEKEIRRQTKALMSRQEIKEEEARSSVMKDYKQTHKRVFTGGVNYWATFSILFGGSVDKKYHSYSGFVLGAFMVGVKGDFTWSWFFPAPAITLSINVGFKFGIGLALRIDMDDKLVFEPGTKKPKVIEGPVSAELSLLLSAGLSLSFSAGWKILGVALTGFANLNAKIPLIKGSNTKKGVSFSFVVGVSLSFQFFFARWSTILAMGSIGMENGYMGKWSGTFVGKKKKDAAASEETTAASPAMPRGSSESIEEKESFSPNLGSSVSIKYDSQATGSLPMVETSLLVRDGGKDYQATVKFEMDEKNTMQFYGINGYSHNVNLHGQPITKDNIVGMTVALASTHWHVQDGKAPTPVNFGALLIQYATGWKQTEVALPDGKKETVTTPDTTRTITIFFWIINGQGIVQRWKYTGVGSEHNSVYNTSDQKYEEAQNYKMYVWEPSLSHFDENYDRCRLNSGGLHCFITSENAVDRDNIQIQTVLFNHVEFETSGQKRAMKNYKGAKELNYIDVNGRRSAVMIKSDGLYLDSDIWNSGTKEFKLLGGNISDFEVYKDSDGITHILCLKEYSEKSSTTVYNKLVGVTISSDYNNKTVTEYDIRANTGNIFCVGDYFGSKNTAVVWIEQEGTSGKAVKNLKCAYYDPTEDAMYPTVTLGVLDESTVPAGYEFESFHSFLQSGTITIKYARKNEKPVAKSINDELYMRTTLPKVISARLIGAASTEPLVTAGRSAEFTLTVHNAGNTFLTALNLELYTKDSSGAEHIVQEIKLNLINPKKSVNISYNDAGEEGLVEEGEKGARRIGGVFDQTNCENWTVLTTKSAIGKLDGKAESRNVHSKALFPDTTQTYQGSYNVPGDWQHGKRVIYVRLRGYDTVANLSDMLVENAESAPTYSLMEVDGETFVRFISPDTDPVSDFRSQLANIDNNETDGADSDFMLGLDSYEMVTDTIGWEAKVADLATDYRLFEANGEEYVSFSITQQGSPNASSSRGVTVRAWTDDPEHYSFSHTFATHVEPGIAYNITIPVDKLTSGKKVESVTLCVMDSNEAISELSEYDNSYTFYIGKNFHFVLQPEDASVFAGGEATFTAAAEGGTKPYTWSWYYCLPGTEGEWVKIENAKKRAQSKKTASIELNGQSIQIEGTNTDTLTMTDIPLEMNGALIRCEVEDKDGETIVSENAVLTVNKIPGTGDDTNLRLWFSLLALSLISIVYITEHRRKAHNNM